MRMKKPRIGERGSLAFITTLMSLPALMCVLLIYDTGVLMTGRTGAYDTAVAAASLITSQRIDQTKALLSPCDEQYFDVDELNELIESKNWTPFQFEGLVLENGVYEITFSVLVDRSLVNRGIYRVPGKAWLSAVTVHEGGTC